MGSRYLPIDRGDVNHPLTQKRFPHGMADPVLFMATLNVAATHLDICHGRHSSPMTMARKGETIRLVNERLQHPTQVLVNETIRCIVMLAAMEVCPVHDLIASCI